LGKTGAKLESITIFVLLTMCFVGLASQKSSKGESSYTQTVWQFLTEQRPLRMVMGVDGYLWRKMPEVQKYGYITGYEMGFRVGVGETWVVATGETDTDQWPFDMSPVAASYEELTEAVDGFYSNYANRGIFLSFALPIIIGRIEGYISDKEAEEKIEESRRASSEIRRSR